ncbi:MAG TPA: NAD(P)-dependent oxidoreductase, partial [Saliniramus sp.]|nr:NAD(P)-dependent oxidoreductase [Saliniramus sp.]
GLGRMGFAMTQTLLREGFAVIAYDVLPAARERAGGIGATVADSLSAMFAEARIVVSSLPQGADVEAVVAGDGGLLASAQEPGTLLIDTSTSEPSTTRRLHALLRERGHGMLDAPVSGGPAGALAGTLTMMIGGEEADLARAGLVLAALSGKIIHVGGPGAGNVAKLVNNLLCAAHLLTNGEALRIAGAAGVDPESVMRAVNAASGRSGVSEVNVPRWILSETFDSGFTMGLMRKDVRLAVDMLQSVGATAPLSTIVGAIWAGSADVLADEEDFNRMAEIAPYKRANDNG